MVTTVKSGKILTYFFALAVEVTRKQRQIFRNYVEAAIRSYYTFPLHTHRATQQYFLDTAFLRRLIDVVSPCDIQVPIIIPRIFRQMNAVQCSGMDNNINAFNDFKNFRLVGDVALDKLIRGF